MKKILLIVSLVLVQFCVKGQSILNGDFENWSNLNYDEPVSWFTSNSESVPAYSIPTVTAVPGYNPQGLCAHLQTYIVGIDTLVGVISNTFQDILQGQGGVPYSETPTDFNGYYRYNLPGDDTALIVVLFKSGGTILSLDILKIKGTGSEPNFVPFNLPLTLVGTPDSVIIAAASSNLLSNQGIADGSWLELDTLTFDGTGITQPIPEGTLNNWINKTIDNAYGWFNIGDGVKQSFDAYTGMSALSLENTDPGTGTQFAAVTSGQQISTGGQPFTNVVDTLVGYYKYSSPGTDTGMANITTILNSTIVGGGIFYFTPTTTYTPFAIPINSNTTPDTIRIDFFSSYYPFDSVILGSKLIIDNLELQSVITGINKNGNKFSSLFSTYPNPVTDKLNITYNGSVEILHTFLYNSIGEVVYESASDNKSLQLELGKLPAGCYWLKMVNGNSVSTRKIIKQ